MKTSKMEQKRYDWLTLIAETKIRLDNGIGISGFIKNSIYVGAGLTIMFDLQVWQSVFTAMLAMVGFYLLGSFDLDLVRLAQKIAELRTEKYNPYFENKKWLKRKNYKGK